MVFTSNIFVFLFLPLYLISYYGVKFQWRSYIIVAGSYLFYAWWRPDFLLLFVGISYWNYYFGMLIKRALGDSKQKAFRLLTLGVVGNLATLGYFKYANFGVDVISAALQQFGINTFTLETIILPLGISFYVFQALSYIVDIYRGKAEPTDRFVDFAAFVALFPQLIAGPILRYSLIDKQLKQRSHDWELFSLGVCRFMLGFTKKVLIADSIAPITTMFISNPEPQLLDTWFGVIAALLQLYFDFSGYSDMAIGLGMMMGFRFAENFNQPFVCQSMTEFWRRWHMTLADFLRDYVFMPITKTRLVSPNTALFLTMLLSGFWHGASFAFIFFGIYFGTFMTLERILDINTKNNAPYSIFKNMTAMFMVLMAMPLFITHDLAHSIVMYSGQLGFHGLGTIDYYLLSTSRMTMLFVLVATIWVIISGIINRRYYNDTKASYFMQHVHGWNSALIWAGFFLAISKLAANSFSPFLYFQF